MSIIVPANGKEVVDLSKDSLIIDPDNHLEACVAVAGRFKNSAALMHLTQLTSLDDYFSWFSKVVPRDGSQPYLIGGMDGRSEKFVDKLRERLCCLPYQMRIEDVLGPSRRSLQITNSGIHIQYLREYKQADEWQLITVGTKTL